MQEQCDLLEAIQFGTMDANSTSLGNQYTAKYLNQIGLVFIPKSHNKVFAQNDKFSMVFHVDPRQRGVSPGLLDLGIGADGQNTAIGQDLHFASPGWLAANE
jgi:hypothetical protein